MYDVCLGLGQVSNKNLQYNRYGDARWDSRHGTRRGEKFDVSFNACADWKLFFLLNGIETLPQRRNQSNLLRQKKIYIQIHD